MYTSYYANLKKIPAGLVPVAISVGVPRWFKGRTEIRLAPTRAMLEYTAKQYDKCFAEILKKLDPREVYESLGENAVMLCWEKAGLRCHRRWVAEWLEQSLGSEIPELGVPRAETPTFKTSPPKK